MNAQNLMDAANNNETDEGQLRFLLSNAAVELQKYKDALEKIASYDDGSTFGKGLCVYGCDTPHIAQKALGLLDYK